MKKTILIAPFDGPIAAALAAEARASGWRVVLALRPEGGEGPVPTHAPDDTNGPSLAPALDSIVLSWNPGSFVSASTLLVAARTQAGEIDAAAIVADPAALRVDLLGGRPGEVEDAVLRATLGPAFLARELARRFGERQGGDILLFMGEPPEDAPSAPAVSLAAGAFRGLGEGLFAAAREAPYAVYGVLEKSGAPDQAARFALRLLDERKSGKSGRWLRFGGKAGIFGVF